MLWLRGNICVTFVCCDIFCVKNQCGLEEEEEEELQFRIKENETLS